MTHQPSPHQGEIIMFKKIASAVVTVVGLGFLAQMIVNRVRSEG